MKSYTFRVIVEEDAFEDGRIAYHAYIPALRDKGGSSWGYSVEEAIKNIREVAELVIGSLLAHGEMIPSEPADQVRVTEEPLVTVTTA